MKISADLTKWFSSIRNLAFKNKDGFYQIPLVSNSPELIIKSLARMPYVYNDIQREVFGTNNRFVDAEVPYQKIEDGLWIFHSKTYYKKNINFIISKEDEVSNDFYKVYLDLNSNKSSHKNVLLNGVPYSNSCWVLQKPFDTTSYCKFKGCKTTSLVLHFNEKWLNNVLKNQLFYKKSELVHFFKSKAKILIISEESSITEKLKTRSKELFEKKSNRLDHIDDWKNLALDFLCTFIDKFNEENINAKMYEFNHPDRVALAKAEKILMDGLHQEFVGIDNLANQVGLSPTKLKSNFKMVYGTSVFQYFRSTQMKQAKVVLEKNEGLKIQKLALMFGYKNMTKFANAFKKEHGVFPSEVSMV